MSTAPNAPATPSCYKHPNREYGAICRRCDRPICADCMVEAPVGWQCRECVHDWNKKAPATKWQPKAAGVRGFGLGNSRMTPVTGTLIAVNVVVFLVSGFGSGSLVGRFEMVPALVHQEPYRLLTAAFLHANWLHIAFNMYALAIFGPAVESIVGRVRFGLLYLTAGLGGGVASYLLSPELWGGVGASGAIFGLMGAYFVLARHHRLDTSAVIMVVVMNVIIGFVDTQIDWRTHLGGLVVGAVVAFGYTRAEAFRGRSAILVQAGVLLVTLAALGGLLLVPAGQVNWT